MDRSKKYNGEGRVLKGEQIPGTRLVQVEELITLTEALIRREHGVNIYTDSRYAFGVVYDYKIV